MNWYIYSFEGGGWNTQQATNIRSARKRARDRWADSSTLNPVEDSFRKVTWTELESIYRMTA
jgi:hypothetical protein